MRTSAVFPSRLYTERTLAAAHHLAAGDYELWWRVGAGENAPARSLAFTIAAGATELVLTLP